MSDSFDRYELRHSVNGQNIDIVPTGAGKGCGALVRVPVRSGMIHHAQETAALVCKVLNEHAQSIHQDAKP